MWQKDSAKQIFLFCYEISETEIEECEEYFNVIYTSLPTVEFSFIFLINFSLCETNIVVFMIKQQFLSMRIKIIF
jgi:hypothetical protein